MPAASNEPQPVAATSTLKIQEKPATSIPGIPLLLLFILLLAGGTLAIILGSISVSSANGGSVSAGAIGAGIVVDVATLILALGLVPVAPGEARVIKLFPSLPIEIAAVVVWQVWDTAKAVFAVDDFVQFVAKQAETAVRHVATNYPYDSHRDGRLSLRDNADEITAELTEEIAARVAPAGVHVIESRITHLAYAPEIAQAMLRRQQADAVVAARQRIVEGAIGMVQQALEQLTSEAVVELDEERKAAMVSNLLVVLCSEQATQPVVNTGTLYH
jgi:hypothetical protein